MRGRRARASKEKFSVGTGTTGHSEPAHRWKFAMDQGWPRCIKPIRVIESLPCGLCHNCHLPHKSRHGRHESATLQWSPCFTHDQFATRAGDIGTDRGRWLLRCVASSAHGCLTRVVGIEIAAQQHHTSAVFTLRGIAGHD